MEEKEQADTTTSPAEETEIQEPSQQEDPIKEELERVQKRPKRTKLEQLEYTQKRVAEQLAEERKKAGIEDDDNRPLTVAEFRAMQAQTAQDTALKLADAIESEPERELVKYHLENTIKPSGDPQTDLKNARLIVNAVKNRQVAEETIRAQKPRMAGSGAGAPPKEQREDELTQEETLYMQAFKLSKEEVLAARPKE